MRVRRLAPAEVARFGRNMSEADATVLAVTFAGGRAALIIGLPARFAKPNPSRLNPDGSTHLATLRRKGDPPA